jgi:hypothetical protein
METAWFGCVLLEDDRLWESRIAIGRRTGSGGREGREYLCTGPRIEDRGSGRTGGELKGFWTQGEVLRQLFSITARC